MEKGDAAADVCTALNPEVFVGDGGDIGVQDSLDTVLNTPDWRTRRPCISGFTYRRRALINQLLTVVRDSPVSMASIIFSSSEGYGSRR